MSEPKKESMPDKQVEVGPAEILTACAIGVESFRACIAIAMELRPHQRAELYGACMMLKNIQETLDRLAPEPRVIQRVVPRLLMPGTH
jgi:hypothetical protein